MTASVIDIEANGFLDEVDKVWCAVCKNIYTGQVERFQPNDLGAFINYLEGTECFIGHNIISYDIPVISKCMDYRYNGTIIDTLTLSRTLNPDRKLPEGCPTHIYNPISGKKEPVGPQSLAAWGYRVGRGKPEHHDWLQYSPEMLHRCSEDVEINYLTLLALLHEAAISPKEIQSIMIPYRWT